MNLHQQGADLIHQLKEHVLEVFRSHPDAGPGAQGILQTEVARRGGLHSKGSVELDHTCGEMLRLLHKEGKIEPVEGGDQDEIGRHWRLSQG